MFRRFDCYTVYTDKFLVENRSITCYELQLAVQSALLVECQEVVRAVKEGKTLLPETVQPIYIFLEREYRLKAAALLPKLEAALKEKP
jgi:hypothetical protein